MSVCFLFVQCSGTKSHSKKSSENIVWPSTSNWSAVNVKGVSMKLPPEWKADYINGRGIVLEIYPDQLYDIKTENSIVEIMLMFEYDGTLEEFIQDEDYAMYTSFDLNDQKEWLQNARSNIVWHVETDKYVYFEAIDGGEKTHSCYGQKEIRGDKYWFSFDGLRYLGDDEVVRLTQEDCLKSILVFKSMQWVGMADPF